MLEPGPRAAARSQRRLRGIAVRLFQRDVAVPIGVGRAEERGDEVMREERALQLLRLLRILVRRARREEREPLPRQMLVDPNVERRRRVTAFHARQRTGATRVEEE